MNGSELELYGIVGKMFREIREEKGLSLTSVSEYLQIAPISLQRYECGERKIKIGTIKELCDFYKIKYDDFIKEAKLRFGKDLYNKDPSLENKSPKIITYYNQLNTTGKEAATEHVRLLTLDEKYTRPDKIAPITGKPLEDPYEVSAAHENRDATGEDKQFDEDLMDNDEIWS